MKSRKKPVAKRRKKTAAKKNTRTTEAKNTRKKRRKIANPKKRTPKRKAGKPAASPRDWNTGDDATNIVIQEQAHCGVGSLLP
jgi:hypothetical protein